MAQLFRVIDLQNGPKGNGAINRYWFDNPSSTDVSLAAVAQEVADWHIDLVRLVQSVDWSHVALLVENVLNGATALFTLIGYIGQRNNSTTPASNAWSFNTKPAGPEIKRGGKRIVGVGEGDSEDDEATSGMLTILSNLAPIFYAPLPVGSVNLKPAIVRPIGNPVTSYLVSPITSAIYRGIGTQVTRKLGRGGTATSANFVANEYGESPSPPASILTNDPADWYVHAQDRLVDRLAATDNFVEHTYTL